MLAPDVILQDRYRIVNSVAQGGMGAVYQATDQRLGHTVAIKQILSDEATLRLAFEQEARLLAALSHPALPRVIDHFVEPAGQFLVMEFVPGDDLATRALRQSEPLAVIDVLRWADQLLDLLAYLHSQNPPVIHRDIKPHNLKINAQGGVMLLDFGLAKGAPGQAPTDRSLAGYTLHYASPEQLRGEQSEPASDLYSLAATLYDLLTATKPPHALHRLATIATGQADPLQPVSLRNAAVPLAVADAIHQALALSPQARFTDATAMRIALHRAGDATVIVAPAGGGETATSPHNLPVQLTSFVAREPEVAAVQQLLQAEGVRLVTLTGPGGIGKTRLSLALAMRALAQFRDGVYFVSLAAIDESALFLPTLAQTLGLREMPNTTVRQSLHAYLQDKTLFLLLDNFEQIIEAAPEVSALLAGAPRLKILVTSREALQVRGEHEFPVPVLEMPDLRQLPAPEEMGHFAAIRLFVQRAQAVKPDFVLDHTNAATVAQLCKRLDGLPLALELAAATVKVLPVQAILARLAERLELPTKGLRDLPDRQRTLRASIRWSYDLLAHHEKALFRRLCIFSGSFALGAAETIWQKTGMGEMDVLDTVAALVAKSLLNPREPKPAELGENEPRFAMLETIREFGLKQLDEEGEREAVSAAHAAQYVQLAQEADRHMWGATVAEWVSRLDAENENLRAALTYYLAHAQGAEASLLMAGSLWRFWEIRGYFQEGRAWLDRAIQRRAEVHPSKRWLPLHGAGNLATDLGDYATANSHYQESLELLQSLLSTLTDAGEILRTRYAIAKTMINLGNTALLQSQSEHAFALTEAALQLHQLICQQSARFDVRVGMALTINNLGAIKLAQSDYTQAATYSTESLAIYRQLGDERGIGWNLHRLGTIARDQGDYHQAVKLYQEAKILFDKLSNEADMATLHFDIGELARLQGEDERAETEYKAGLALAQAMGNKKETANMLDRLGVLARCQGNYANAQALSEESIALQREIGNLFGLSDALQNRGAIAFVQGNLSAAAADFTQSLQLKAELGERKGIIELLKAMAALDMAGAGEAMRSVQLFAAAEALRLVLGIQVPLSARAADDAMLLALRSALVPEKFAAAWDRGQRMEWKEAIAYALTAVAQ